MKPFAILFTWLGYTNHQQRVQSVLTHTLHTLGVLTHTLHTLLNEDTKMTTSNNTANTANTANDAAMRAEIIARRNALMSQSTANQTDSFKEMLTTFRVAFPEISEVTEIVVKNGGLKQSAETKNTTMVLYIVQIGAETFNNLYDAFKPSSEQLKNLTAAQIELKHAEHALGVYRAMITIDKYSNCINATSKFTNNAVVAASNATKP